MPLTNPIAVTVLRQDIILSDAQIKPWPTTPITIVEADAGKLFVPLYAGFFADLEAEYTNIHATDGRIIIEDGVTGSGLLHGPINDGTIDDFGALFGSYGEGFLRIFCPATPAAKAAAAGVVVPTAISGDLASNSLVLRCINGNAGDFTSGHANNTIKASVFYVEYEL